MKTILLIDDSSFTRASLTDLLEMEGFKVLEAPDGTTGLKLARHEKPDLILCDMLMPGLTGQDVLRILRCSPSIANTPFIFLSAMVEKEIIGQGLREGANAYLTKPFARTELLFTVSYIAYANRQN